MKKAWVWILLIVLLAGFFIFGLISEGPAGAEILVLPFLKACQLIFIVTGTVLLGSRVLGGGDLVGPGVLLLAGSTIGGLWGAGLGLALLLIARLTLNFLRERQKSDA